MKKKLVFIFSSITAKLADAMYEEDYVETFLRNPAKVFYLITFSKILK